MLSHPWFQTNLTSDVKLNHAKTALQKYVSIRKDKSQRFKKENPTLETDDI